MHSITHRVAIRQQKTRIQPFCVLKRVWKNIGGAQGRSIEGIVLGSHNSVALVDEDCWYFDATGFDVGVDTPGSDDPVVEVLDGHWVRDGFFH